jgi:hypothetical protein
VGTSRSAVSRRFVTATAERLDQLLHRALGEQLRREHGVLSAGNGCCGCYAVRGCWRRRGSGADAGRDPMTARSSLSSRTCVGHGCDHGLDRGRRLGVGVRGRGPLPAEAWAPVAKVGDRFAAYSRSTTRSSTAGVGWMRIWLVACRCGTTGDPNTSPATSSARSPGGASATTPPSWASRRPTAARSAGSHP